MKVIDYQGNVIYDEMILKTKWDDVQYLGELISSFLKNPEVKEIKFEKTTTRSNTGCLAAARDSLREEEDKVIFKMLLDGALGSQKNSQDICS